MTRNQPNLNIAVPKARRRGFTVLELMVSVAILVVTIVAVSAVFRMSTDAAGRTAAHAELLEASATLQNALTNELAQMAPGLLIIESPPPTSPRAEVSTGQRLYRLRHDRLVFMMSKGSEGSLQSTTDPKRGMPAGPGLETDTPATASEALIYIGPGIPLTGDGTAVGIERPIEGPGAEITLTASEWILAHRAILLMTSDPDTADIWTPPDMRVFTLGGAMLDGGALLDVYYDGRMDAVISDPTGATANASTFASLIVGRTFANATPQLAALWEPSLTPATVSLPDPTLADYYQRTGTIFMPRLADFRIEWTDGRRVNPLGNDDISGTPAADADNDYTTRWFGLAPYRGDTVDVTDTSGLRYIPRLRSVADEGTPGNPSNPNLQNPDNPTPETLAFANIEWSPTGIAPDANAQYRAVWTNENWDYRPKALRFTYRLYDANARLHQPASIDLNEDGVADVDGAGDPYLPQRFGQEFSIVVSIP